MGFGRISLFPIVTALIVLLCQLYGCSDNKERTTFRESYIGLYEVNEVGIADFKRDSVSLSIVESSYSISILHHIVGGPICGSSGSILNFGTDRVTFNMMSTFGSNCDTRRVPHTTFVARYPSAAGVDSLILVDTTDITFTTPGGNEVTQKTAMSLIMIKL
ncbi:MAG: hypothetical protein ACE5FH_04135 [Candidatus Zixiibacteriota bacterium]